MTCPSASDVSGDVAPKVLLLGFVSVVLSDMDVRDTMSKNSYSFELCPDHSYLKKLHRELFELVQYVACRMGPQFAAMEVPHIQREKFYELIFELNKPPYSMNLPLSP